MPCPLKMTFSFWPRVNLVPQVAELSKRKDTFIWGGGVLYRRQTLQVVTCLLPCPFQHAYTPVIQILKDNYKAQIQLMKAKSLLLHDTICPPLIPVARLRKV